MPYRGIIQDFRCKTLILASILGISACVSTSTIENFQGTSSAEAPGVMIVRTGWVKDKNKIFDAELWFTNNSKNAIAMPVDKITCSRGALPGTFGFLKFRSRVVELEPGEQRRLVATCATGTKNKGEWVFSFQNISVRKNDGSLGKVLASEIVLKLNAASR